MPTILMLLKFRQQPLSLYRKSVLTLFLTLSFFSQTSYAQVDLSIRAWSNAVELLESKVLETLRQEMANQPCENDVGSYTGAYFDKLQLIRAEVDPPLYLMFREVGQATNHEIGPLEDFLPCDKHDRWPLVEAAIYRQLEYTANILAIVQTALDR